jgi:alkylation response protein AidB-like acyl-CoA dehydrogenase
MDFALSDEQQAMRESTSALLRNASPTTAVRAIAEAGTGFDQALWRKGAELGWPALAVPEDSGGLGQGIVDLTLIGIEHGRHLLPSPQIPIAIVADALASQRDGGELEDLLAPMLDGSLIATWAFGEPGRPWLADELEFKAHRAPSGFTLNGRKSSVQDAGSAQQILVDCRLDDGELARFAIPTSIDGVTIRRQRTLDITREFDDVTMSDVHVPAAALITSGDAARAGITRSGHIGAVLACAEMVGAAERVLDMTIEYAKVRCQFGRPIGSFQAVKHKCATMRMWAQASAAATYYAAMALDAGTDDAAQAVSVAKSYVSEAVCSLVGEALQVHGGIGFTWEHDLHLYIRRVRANAVLYGDVRHHRAVLCRWLEEARHSPPSTASSI